MADTILTPSVTSTDETEERNYLVKENYLSEFGTDDEKSVVRANLGIYASDAVYTKEETEEFVNIAVAAALVGYVTSDELPSAIAELSDEIANAGYVRSDGTVPFTSAQTQAALPTSDYHLANKIYVDNALTAHVNADDPHGTLDQVEVLLANYAKLSDVYTSSNSYSRKEVDSLLSGYVKRDGSTAFTNPQVGVDPTLPSHLATQRYVKQVMDNHKSETDPHAFIATLKRYLSNYYTKSETYTKAQTYSRAQLVDIIKSQMNDIVDQAIATHVATDGSVSELKDYVINVLYDCVRADGSVTHTAPQAGVAAVNDNEFIVLSQLREAIESLGATLTEAIADATNQSTWIPTGPVETTVGFVEDNTILPPEMTVQQIMDAIFYGKQVGITVDKYAEYGSTVCMKIYVHGLSTLTSAEIYKNDVLVGTLSPSDFIVSDEDGIYYEYCDSEEFTEDTEWKVIFYYSDGQTITDTATTYLAYAMFVGALPYWWNASEDITMDRLREVVDLDSQNNVFMTELGSQITKYTMTFDFTDAMTRSITVVVPYDYPDLVRMVTPTQTVTAEAFTKTVMPMYPNNAEVGVNYKIYVFNQPLVTLSQTVEFYFGESDEEDDNE